MTFKKFAFTLTLTFFVFSIIKAQTGKIIVPDGNSTVIRNIIADKQGKYIYTIGSSKIVMWDLKTGDQLYSFPGAEDITQVALSEDGTKLAIGTSVINCYDTFNGELLFENHEHYYGGGIAFSMDGNQLYAIYNGLFQIDVRTGKSSKIVDNSFEQYKAQTLTLKNGFVAIANKKGWQVWNPSTKQLVFKKSFETERSDVYFHAYMSFVVFYQRSTTNGSNQNLEFYNIETGDLVKKMIIPYGETKFSAAHNSDEFMVSTGLYENQKLQFYSGKDFLLKTTTSPKQDFESAYLQNSGNYFLGVRDRLIQLNSINVNLSNEFKGKVIKIEGIRPIYSNVTGKVSVVSSGDVAKIVDMSRMVGISSKKLSPKPYVAAFTNSGDTVAIFDDVSVTIKNLRTGVTILPKKILGSGEQTYTLLTKAYFFSNDGRSLYYLLDAAKTSGQRLMKMDMVSKAVSQKVEFKGITSISPTSNRKLLEVVQGGGSFEVGCIIDIETGRSIFEESFPRTNAAGQYNEPAETLISLSLDKKKVIFIHQDVMSIYNYPSGQPIAVNTKIPSLDKFGTNTSNSDLTQIIKADRNGNFEAYTFNGKKQYSIANAHNSAITDIMFSPDDKVFYTFSYDQTIKTWKAENGELLGTLYLFNDGLEYVFVNKEGRFDGTAEGIKKLYYFDKRVKISLDVIYERFYTPNLYARLLVGERFEPISIKLFAPPKVKMTYAATQRNLEVENDQPNYQNTTGAAEITVTATTQEDKIDEIRLFHNGKIVTLTTRNLIIADGDNIKNITKKYSITLLPGVNNIRALALNSQRTESQPDNLTINYKNTTAVNPASNNVVVGNGSISLVDKAATMHLIVVGINAYDNSTMTLNYALADATAFKNEFEKDAKSVITNIKTHFVTDKQADKNGIISAFKEVQLNAKPQDIFVFYYAGHGVIGKDKEFYLVPRDVSNLNNVQVELEQKAISSKLLQQYAIDISAQKQLFILDACQSAGAFEKMLSANSEQQKSLAVVARSTGTHWMAASGAMQFANEFSSLGHGVFTYVLLQALKGEAASNKMITVNGLKSFLQSGVPALMKKYNGAEQYPASYGFGNDFPVEVIK